MKNKIIRKSTCWIITCLLLGGCSKNDTHYYSDAENESLGIFSNTGNNLLTCLVNNNAWRTDDRTFSLFTPGGPRYEVYIRKQISTSLMDTLYIEWTGYFASDRNGYGFLSLQLPVAKNFGYRDLAAYNGRRYRIDTANGFFTFYSAYTNAGFIKGTGNVYFHKAVIDSIGPNNYSGRISGLFDADFISTKITKGRFDHNINSVNVRLP